MKIVLIGFLAFLHFGVTGRVQPPSDQILGKWISTQGNVIVDVYKESDAFKGKVVWFKDTDDKSRPMATRTDIHNPDPALRDRKIIGMDVLTGLEYNNAQNRWEHGKIYDVKTGKEWSTSVWITKEGLLKVKGYWHFEFLGQTMTFRRA